MERFLKKQWKRGASMVEYGLLIALIAIVLVGVLVFLADALSATFTGVASVLGKAP